MGEIFATLGFDWKIALFNLINFSIIFFLMKKMVFAKVGAAIENRQKKAQSIIRKEAQLERELKDAKSSATEIINEAQEKAHSIITEGQKTAEEQAVQIRQKAQMEAEAMRKRAQEQIAEERKNAFRDMQGDISDLVIEAAQKVVGSKVDEEEDVEFVTQTISQLQRD